MLCSEDGVFQPFHLVSLLCTTFRGGNTHSSADAPAPGGFPHYLPGRFPLHGLLWIFGVIWGFIMAEAPATERGSGLGSGSANGASC